MQSVSLQTSNFLRNKYNKSMAKFNYFRRYFRVMCKSSSKVKKGLPDSNYNELYELKKNILKLKQEKEQKLIGELDYKKYALDLEHERKLELQKQHSKNMNDTYDKYLTSVIQLQQNILTKDRTINICPFLNTSNEFQVFGNPAIPLIKVYDLKRQLPCSFKAFDDLIDSASNVENNRDMISCFNAKYIVELFMNEIKFDTDFLLKTYKEEFNKNYAFCNALNFEDVMNNSSYWGTHLPLITFDNTNIDYECDNSSHCNYIMNVNKHIDAFKEHCRSNPTSSHELKYTLSNILVRLQVIFDRIAKYDVYMPDVLERYVQDQEAQKNKLMRKTLASRKDTWIFKVGMKEHGKCECCNKEIKYEEYERGHIVPSKNNTCGSNGSHNILILCKHCNADMSDMDAILYKDITSINK